MMVEKEKKNGKRDRAWRRVDAHAPLQFDIVHPHARVSGHSGRKRRSGCRVPRRNSFIRSPTLLLNLRDQCDTLSSQLYVVCEGTVASAGRASTSAMSYTIRKQLSVVLPSLLDQVKKTLSGDVL